MHYKNSLTSLSLTIQNNRKERKPHGLNEHVRGHNSVEMNGFFNTTLFNLNTYIEGPKICFVTP